MIKKRHHSRELALQILYADEFRLRNNENTENNLLNDLLIAEKEDEVRAYVIYLVNGVKENKQSLDAIIDMYSLKRKAEEIAIIDLCILRLSIFSLLYDDSLHPSIVIDEAVKLSKEFSNEKNYKFINGVLDAYVRKEVQNDTVKKQN